jgi:AcrR family transcriptional regulator
MNRGVDGRSRLLAAARRAATETAATRVSLRDIAKAAGLSPAACYRYFPSRERLADALAVEVCAEIVTAMREAAHAETGAHDRLTAAARAYLGYAVTNRGAFDLAFERGEGDWAATERAAAGMDVAHAFGELAERPGLGPALWGAVHGLVDLLLKGLIDIGQRDHGASVIPSRGDTLMRGLIEGLVAG